MSINFDKHRELIVAAWKEVLDDKSSTNWALYGYDGLSNDLRLVSKGDGGLGELVEDLNSGKIMYGFLRVDIPESSIPKYVLINWQGEGAPTVRKGSCANHVRNVSALLCGAHVTLHARAEDDLDEALVMRALAGSATATPRRDAPAMQRAPVGTSYQKVNPGKEINSKERDQFWLKEEAEEMKRVAAEKKRREEDKQKTEEAVKKRDEQEAAKRELTQTDPSGVSTSEALRRQRSAEARQLIGQSTSAARAMFQQNLAQGQMTNSRIQNSTPEKPVRSSVVAQRINSLTQQQMSPTMAPTSPTKAPTSPTKAPTSPTNAPISPTNAPTIQTLQQDAPPPPKTSPIKTIDKIKMSLESPSQIQHEHIIDPSSIGELSPSESETTSFTSVLNNSRNEHDTSEDYECLTNQYRPIKISADLTPDNPIVKQNILENDMFDASYSSSSNENDDDDSDNKFSTIKRSPYTKNNASSDSDKQGGDLSRQNTVIENVDYKNGGTSNGTGTLEDISPEDMEDDVYQDLDDDTGLTARALYDYQAADESEITFDPGDIISHIDQIDEGWWQGLGPHGNFGLFPANYVELLPCKPKL